MSKGIFIAGNIAFIIVFGLIANEMGVAAQTIDIPTSITAPSNGNFLEKVIAPFVWAFDASVAFIQLITISYNGVGPVVYSIVFAPLIMLDIFIIYGMIRGGGT